MNIKAIRTALATLVVPGFNVYPSFVGATSLDMIVIGSPTSITYVTTYGGQGSMELPVRVVVSRKSEQYAQDILDGVMSLGTPNSFIDAMLALEGPWKNLSVNSVGEPSSVQVGNTEAVEVEFALNITARKDQ